MVPDANFTGHATLLALDTILAPRGTLSTHSNVPDAESYVLKADTVGTAQQT